MFNAKKIFNKHPEELDNFYTITIIISMSSSSSAALKHSLV